MIEKGIRRSDLKSDKADLSISSKRFGTESSMDSQPGTEKSSYIRTTQPGLNDTEIHVTLLDKNSGENGRVFGNSEV